MDSSRERKLVYFLNNHVRGIYFFFDRAHDERHYDEVMSTTLDLASKYNMTDFEFVCLISAAAYHDVGRLINDADHHIYSAKIYKNDINFKKFLETVYPELKYNEVISKGRKIILNHRSKKKTKDELCLILKDADKVSHLNKERGLYRPIAYFIDRLWDKENIYSIVINRVDYFGGTIKFSPKCKAMKHQLGNEDKTILITEEDIENMVYKVLEEEGRNYD